MNLKYIWLLLCLITTEIAYAQIKISGRVVDNATQKPLSGATVSFGEKTINTSADGKFELMLKTTVSGVLKVHYIGYNDVHLNITNNRELNIGLSADNLHLNEVIVTGFSNNKRLQDIPGSIGLITEKDLKRGNTFSLQPVLNIIPGVQVDQSNLAETRIAIRGVGVRSSYGNRNLKFYINDIPITEADGFTRIEGIDVATLGKVEVIKGPASSIYGFGTGGVLNFEVQKAAYNEKSLSTEAMVGSYGFHRIASSFRSGSDKMNIVAAYGWQEYDGYREHNRDIRRFLTTNAQFYPSDKQTVSIFINRTTQRSQIPGALNSDQLADDRKQAAPANLQLGAGRNQTWTRIGISHDYQILPSFKNITSVFTSFYDLDHPLPYAYLRGSYQSYGGRTRFVYDAPFSSLPTRFIIGAEYLNGLSRNLRYVNVEGSEGAIIFNGDQNNTQYSIFYQSETRLSEKWLFTLGASYNKVNYDAKDFLVSEKTGKTNFDPQFTPRVALSYLFHPNHSIHTSMSYGFAPPSSSEVNNADGTINQSIRPEKGINYEINAKGSFLNKELTYDLSLYRFNLKDELIPQTVAQSVTIYNNAGRTRRNGAELGIYYSLLLPDVSWIETIRPFFTVTYADFKFQHYTVYNASNEIVNDYSGNALTGIMPWSGSIGLDFITKPGFYLYTTYYLNDKMPMNDANTDFNAAYKVLNTKLGYQRLFQRNWETNISVGVDNLLNEKYSSNIALNAVSYTPGVPAAYFNPSPERMWYINLGIKYIFTN